MSSGLGVDAKMPIVNDEPQDGVFNGNVLDDMEPENLPVKEGRIIKKAKRPSKYIVKGGDSSVDVVSPVTIATNRLALANAKNSRKPRNLKGRGLPKKGKSVPRGSVALFINF